MSLEPMAPRRGERRRQRKGTNPLVHKASFETLEFRIVLSASSQSEDLDSGSVLIKPVIESQVPATSEAIPYSNFENGNSVVPLNEIPAGLPAPTLTSPANGVTGQSTHPTFSWNAVSGASTYRLLIATSPGSLPSGSNDPVGSFVVNQTTSATSLQSPATLTPGVTYYWQVRAGNTSTGAGGLWSSARSFTVVSPPQGDSVEPNNTPATATVLPSGQLVASDHLDGRPGRPNTLLGLFDPSLTVLQAVDDNSSPLGNGFASQLTGIPLRSDGSIHFKVTHASDTTFAGNHAQSGRYAYHLDVRDPNGQLVPGRSQWQNDEISPGNVDSIWLTPAPHPTNPTWEGYTVDMTLNNVVGPGTGDALDFFVFTGLQPFEPFTATLNGDFAALIAIYNAANARIATSNPLDAIPTLYGTADASGRVKIGVTGAADTNFTGAHVAAGQFTLQLAVEPGDRIDGAAALGTLVAGGSVSRQAQIGDGSFGLRDVDLFRFALTSSTHVTFSVDTPGSPLDAHLRLFNANGIEVAANDDRAPGNFDPRLTVTLPPGTYYAGVSGSPNRQYNPHQSGSGVASSTTGSYMLSVSVPAGGGESIADQLATYKQVKELLQPAFNGDGHDLSIVLNGATINQAVDIYVGITNGSQVHVGSYINVAGLATWQIDVELFDVGLPFANYVSVVSDQAVSITGTIVNYVTAAVSAGFEAVLGATANIQQFLSDSYEDVAKLFQWNWGSELFTPVTNIASAGLDWSKQTILLTHGWLDRLDLGDPKEFMEVFARDFKLGRTEAELTQFQILAVDWWDGGSTNGSSPSTLFGLTEPAAYLNLPDAIRSSNNGIEAAKPLARKLSQSGINPAKTMLIGHSNGAGFMASLGWELFACTNWQTPVAELVALDAPFLTASYWKVQRSVLAFEHVSNYYIPASQLDLGGQWEWTDLANYFSPAGGFDLRAGFGWPMYLGNNVTNFEFDGGVTYSELWQQGLTTILTPAHSQIPLRYALTAHKIGSGPFWGFRASSFAHSSANGYVPPQQDWIWREVGAPGVWLRLPHFEDLTQAAFDIVANTAQSIGNSLGGAAVSVWGAGVRGFENFAEWGESMNASLMQKLDGTFGLFHFLFSANSPAFASFDVNVPADAVLLSFDLTVVNPGNADTLQVAIEDQVLHEIDLTQVQLAGARRFELWIGQHAGQSVRLSFHMPSDEPSDAQFLVSGIEFAVIEAAQQAPEIVDVLLSSTTWSASFLAALQTAGLGSGGYSVRSNQGTALPWRNVDKIQVVFSKNTVVDAENLILTSINDVQPDPPEFEYDPETFTATWTLAAPLSVDRLRLALDTESINPVRDVLGNLLSGPANFDVDILLGDVDGDGEVTLDDFLQARALIGQVAGMPGYNPRYDVDGNGGINFGDALLVRGAEGSVLPQEEEELTAPVLAESMVAVSVDIPPDAEPTSVADENVAPQVEVHGEPQPVAIAEDSLGDVPAAEQRVVEHAPVRASLFPALPQSVSETSRTSADLTAQKGDSVASQPVFGPPRPSLAPESAVLAMNSPPVAMPAAPSQPSRASTFETTATAIEPLETVLLLFDATPVVATDPFHPSRENVADSAAAHPPVNQRETDVEDAKWVDRGRIADTPALKPLQADGIPFDSKDLHPPDVEERKSQLAPVWITVAQDSRSNQPRQSSVSVLSARDAVLAALAASAGQIGHERALPNVGPVEKTLIECMPVRTETALPDLIESRVERSLKTAAWASHVDAVYGRPLREWIGADLEFAESGRAVQLLHR